MKLIYFLCETKTIALQKFNMCPKSHLSAIPELRGHAALDGRLHVCRLKHNEGRIASQLERHPFHSGGALLVQDFANVRGASEREAGHQWAFAQHATNGRRVLPAAGDHVEHALGDAGLLGQRRNCQSGQRSVLGWLHHAGAPGSQCSSCLAGYHRNREVPLQCETKFYFSVVHHKIISHQMQWVQYSTLLLLAQCGS